MGLFFDGSAASDKLLNSVTPITAITFSAGAWVLKGALGTSRTWFSIHRASDDAHYFRLYNNASNVYGISVSAGSPNDSTGAVAAVAGAWAYVVGRWITSSNRRMAVLHPTGESEHVQGTNVATPTSLAHMRLGGLRSSSGETAQWLGGIAEFWCANIDVVPGGGAMPDAMLRQLAYGGPFSLPHLVPSIMEYRSFRSALEHPGKPGETYWGGRGVQTWVNTDGKLQTHPPLPYWNKPPPRQGLILL